MDVLRSSWRYSMSDFQEGRYFVVRYMVGDLRDEAVNIGVIGIDEQRRRFTIRFLDDLMKKARVDVPFDPKAVSIYRQTLEQLVKQIGSDASHGDSGWLERFNKLLT